MRRLLPALLLLAASSLFADSLKWTDSIRDVYVNGSLVRAGQTLVSDKLLAWLPPSGQATIFDRGTHEMFVVDRSSFHLADDRTTATTDGDLPRRDAKPFMMPDESTILTTSMLIHPHVSHSGPMTDTDLWTTAPVWRAIYDHYTPDGAVVARLARERTPTTVKIIFATWCGDSKRGVPRLLKALHDASNPRLSVELIGVGNDFLSPLDLLHDEHITNVPTILLERGRNEVGRVVETPATASIEADVAAILDDKLPPHPGRYERKSIIVKGTYDIRDAHGGKATEEFELWNTPDGGLLVKSRITKSGEIVETFAGLDAKREPDFVEVTRRNRKHVVRTRCSLDKGKWNVVARGDEAGIVEQHTIAPSMLVTPATATFGWPLFCAAFNRCDPAAAYLIDNSMLGNIVTMQSLSATPYIPVSTRMPRLRVKAGAMQYEMEAMSALNLPKHIKFADGSERTLVSYSGVLPRAIPAAKGD